MSLSLIIALAGLTLSTLITFKYASRTDLLSPVFGFAAVHTFFIFPKVVALTLSSDSIGNYFRDEGVSFNVAIVSVMCFLAFVLSYRLTAKPSSARLPFTIDDRVKRNLLRFSVLIGGIGILGSALLVLRNGGFLSYYFGAGFYQMGFEGINVWLIFTSRFIYPAIASAMLLYLRNPNVKLFILLTVLLFFPILNITILFRRSDLFFVAFIVFYTTVYVRRPRIGRPLIAILAAAAFVAITVFPYFRQEFIGNATGFTYGTENMTIMQSIKDSFEITENEEIVRAASTIQRVDATGELQLGAFIWNSLISQFLPSSLVGPEFKRSLMISLGGTSGVQFQYFDPESYFYVAPMGFADAHGQFGYFGFIIFGALGIILAQVERRSNKLSNRLFLIIAVPLICLAATNDIGSIPARLVTFWILTRFLGNKSKVSRVRTL